MLRRAAAGGALILLSACATVPGPGTGDPYEIPYDSLTPRQAGLLRRVMEAPTCMVELDRTTVRSTPEVYDFLMQELPFTAGVLRELKESEYAIGRDDDGTYIFDDGEGLRLRAELVRHEGRRWFWYTYGIYDLGLIRPVGRSVIIVRYDVEGGNLVTEARVYAKLEDKVIEAGAKALGKVVEGTIREKAFRFIRVATLVTELTARNARGLYESVRGSEYVDSAVLEEYRKRFVR